MNYGKVHNLNETADMQVTGIISTGVAPSKRMTNTLPSTRDRSTNLLVNLCTSHFRNVTLIFSQQQTCVHSCKRIRGL
jgi:hypothetical protein